MKLISSKKKKILFFTLVIAVISLGPVLATNFSEYQNTLIEKDNLNYILNICQSKYIFIS